MPGLLLHFKLQAIAAKHMCLFKMEKTLNLQVKDGRKTMFGQW